MAGGSTSKGIPQDHVDNGPKQSVGKGEYVQIGTTIPLGGVNNVQGKPFEEGYKK